MAKKTYQEVTDRLAKLAAEVNLFKITLNIDDQGGTKELTLQEWLQTLEAHELVGVKDELAALTKLLGSYADDVDGNLDTNKSVIENLSIAVSNINAILKREKGYAENDLSNVNVGIANNGKFLQVKADGSLEYVDAPSGSGGGIPLIEVSSNRDIFNGVVEENKWYRIKFLKQKDGATYNVKGMTGLFYSTYKTKDQVELLGYIYINDQSLANISMGAYENDSLPDVDFLKQINGKTYAFTEDEFTTIKWAKANIGDGTN